MRSPSANGTSDVVATGVSCATAGNCTAIGNYTDAGGHHQVFLTDEVAGTWPTDRIQAIPGVAILNTGGGASSTTVSCPSAGSCAVGGTYTTIRPPPSRSSPRSAAAPGPTRGS